MSMYQPSPKMVSALLDPEIRSGLSIPISAIVLGILSQVESTIELTNRICDRYMPDRARQRKNMFRASTA